MNRLLIAAVALGGFLVDHGWQEYELAQGATEEPIPVSLSEIEAGQVPSNPHLALGEHWRMYQELVYSYRTDDDTELEEQGPETKLDYSYYPILSVDNPFFREVATLEKLYGSVDAIPDDQYPQRIDFRVLVRSDEFDTVEQLPEPAWTVADGVQGMLVNKVRSLSAEERQLVGEGFPNVDLDSLLILEEGRQPSSVGTSFAFMGGGAVLALAPIVGFAIRGKSRKEEPEVEPEEDAEADPMSAPAHDFSSGRTDQLGGER